MFRFFAQMWKAARVPSIYKTGNWLKSFLVRIRHFHFILFPSQLRRLFSLWTNYTLDNPDLLNIEISFALLFMHTSESVQMELYKSLYISLLFSSLVALNDSYVYIEIDQCFQSKAGEINRTDKKV